MPLSPDEVRHVSMLARLALEEEQVEHLAGELSAILDYAEKVGEVAASDVEAMTHPFPLDNVMRPDDPVPTLDRAELLAQAPESEDDRFVVPRIVAEDEQTSTVDAVEDRR